MRNGLYSLLLFFIIMAILLPVGGLILNLLPIFIMVMIFNAIFSSSDKKTKGKKSKKKTNTTAKKTTKASKDLSLAYQVISNKDRKLIDERLSEYYKDNMSLPIFDNIHLVTKNGKYHNLDDLYIAMNGETIISLSEFGDEYGETFKHICALLVTFAKKDAYQTKTTVNKINEVKQLTKAQSYIEQIDLLNVAIPGEEVSSGLDQTCTLLKQLDLAKKDDDSKVEKLYNYYLPILLNILNNYKDLQQSNADSKEFKESEKQLIKTIILINEALKSINESIHETDYMNLSADITTLQSLLKKDGLVKEGSLYEGEDNE